MFLSHGEIGIAALYDALQEKLRGLGPLSRNRVVGVRLLVVRFSHPSEEAKSPESARQSRSMVVEARLGSAPAPSHGSRTALSSELGSHISYCIPCLTTFQYSEKS